MAEYLEHTTAELNGPAPEVVHEESVVVVPEQPTATVNRHVVAGRKGAERIHQLIERGRLYEQEHGLKRGRQRLRQLIDEGKLYEQEHGLSTNRRKRRGAPLRPDQVVRRLLDTLVRVAKPAYRVELLKLVQALGE